MMASAAMQGRATVAATPTATMALCLLVLLLLGGCEALPISPAAGGAVVDEVGAGETIDSVSGNLQLHGFSHAFVASLAVIVVSELGDKTFFIAAIMAMKHPRLTVFAGAIGALAVMTALSAYLGALATLIPRLWTVYLSTFLFVAFGLKMLHEGYTMAPDEGQEELEEVTMELKKKDEELEASQGSSLVSPILVQAFTLTFFAEWGDRSQIATIILGAREGPLGVTLGAVLGHSICTAIAVIGGRLIAQSISVRTVTLTGGVVFLLFALSGLILEFGTGAGETTLPPVVVP